MCAVEEVRLGWFNIAAVSFKKDRRENTILSRIFKKNCLLANIDISCNRIYGRKN